AKQDGSGRRPAAAPLTELLDGSYAALPGRFDTDPPRERTTGQSNRSNLPHMTTDPTPHLFWITSRAAGTVPLLAASVAVCLGLLMGGRLHKRFAGSDLRAVHEVLSLTTIVAIVVHGLSLVGDR